jgi:hypothetical protein
MHKPNQSGIGQYLHFSKKMILPEGNPFGSLRGRIKCTPEEALKSWGFVMREDATGVIFRGYTYLNPNGKKIRGTFISNYIPPGNPKTEKQKAWRKIMKDAVAHWLLLCPPEQTEWRRKAKKMKMSGYNLHNREWLRTHTPPTP